MTWVRGGRCSHILVSPDGNHVYAASRTDGSIAQFAVAADGTLARIRSVDCGGVCPRNFQFDHESSPPRLRICNQDSQNICSYSLGPDGALTGEPVILPLDGVCPQVISVPIAPEGGGGRHAPASTGSAEHDDYRNEALSRALRPKGQAPRHRAAYYLVHNALLATMSFSLTTGWHGTAALLSSLPSLNNVPGVSGTVSFAIICLCGALSSFFGAATFRAFGFSKVTVLNNAVNGLVILSSLAFPTPLTQYGSTALMGLCVGGAVVAQQSCAQPFPWLLACASCTLANFRHMWMQT